MAKYYIQPRNMFLVFISILVAIVTGQEANEYIRLIEKYPFGYMRADQTEQNLLNKRMGKLIPHGYEAAWVEYTAAADSPMSQHGVKTWGIKQNKLYATPYVPFVHFNVPFYKNYLLRDQSEIFTNGLLLHPELRQTLLISLSQLQGVQYPWPTDLPTVIAQDANMLEHGYGDSFVRFKQNPWQRIFAAPIRANKSNRLFIMLQNQAHCYLLRLSQLYGLVYDNAVFSHFGDYEQLWLAYQFYHDQSMVLPMPDQQTVQSIIKPKQIWHLFFPRPIDGDIQCIIWSKTGDIDFAVNINKHFVHFSLLRQQYKNLFVNMLYSQPLTIPTEWNTLLQKHQLTLLDVHSFRNMVLSVQGIERGIFADEHYGDLLRKELFPLRILESREAKTQTDPDEAHIFVRTKNSDCWHSLNNLQNGKDIYAILLRLYLAIRCYDEDKATLWQNQIDAHMEQHPLPFVVDPFAD